MNEAQSQSGNPGYWLEFAALALLLLLGVLLQLQSAQGPLFSQEINLATEAWEILEFDSEKPAGIFTSARQLYRRLAAIDNENRLGALVLGVVYRLVGVNNQASALPALVASAFTGLLIFVLARIWFGSGAGVLATFFWVSLPMNVFMSTRLLPVMLTIALNLLVVYLTASGVAQASRRYLGAAVVIGCIAVILDWTFSLPILILVAVWANPGMLRSTWLIKNVGASAIILTIVLFVSGSGDSLGVLHNLNMNVFDNFLLIPLIAIAIVASATSDKRTELNLLLIWLGLMLGFYIVAAPWIANRPLVSTLGVGGYWLHVMVPIVIWLSWVFTARIGRQTVIKIVFALSAIAVAIVIVFGGPAFPAAVLTVSRIFIGLALVAIVLNLVVWSQREKIIVPAFAFLLIAIMLALPQTLQSYRGSYAEFGRAPHSIHSYLAGLDQDVILLVGDESLYARMLYANAFQPVAQLSSGYSLSVAPILPLDEVVIPPQSFVLLDAIFMYESFSLIPDHWQLLPEGVANTDEQWLLYWVGEVEE